VEEKGKLITQDETNEAEVGGFAEEEEEDDEVNSWRRRMSALVQLGGRKEVNWPSTVFGWKNMAEDGRYQEASQEYKTVLSLSSVLLIIMLPGSCPAFGLVSL
jgi:hypothetical protein